ncbi:MAG: histidine phosphatase family protein [Alphaproteobacteria bacterium]
MILIRHGESLFNLHYGATRRDPGIEDPGLTDRGKEQALAVARALAEEDIAELVVSPYRRTLETAAIIAAELGIPATIEPLIRERMGFSCDIGTMRSQLALLWPGHRFDHLEERWWHHEDEPEHLVQARCETFRGRMAAASGWRRTAVVTHWGVIRALTGQTVQNGAMLRFDPTGRTVPVD